MWFASSTKMPTARTELSLAWVKIPVLPLTSCVAWEESPCLSELQCPHLYFVRIDLPHEVVRGLNDPIHGAFHHQEPDAQ